MLGEQFSIGLRQVLRLLAFLHRNLDEIAVVYS